MRDQSFKKFQAMDFIHPESNNDTPWFILFHGFGADANDLAGLQDYFQFHKPINLRFVQGPLSVPIGPGWTGRAWWALQLSSLPHDWSDYTPPEIESLVKDLTAYIRELKVPASKIIFGGFSQGAMLATEMFLNYTDFNDNQSDSTSDLNSVSKPLGLCSLSGSLIRKSIWKEKLKNLRPDLKPVKVLLSHGEQDAVLPIKGSQQLLNLFQQNQIQCRWVSFQGGHEIPFKVIEQVSAYVNEINS